MSGAATLPEANRALPPRRWGERFESLDMFRGLTIFFMIVVNTPGLGATPYPQLEHAAWIGFTAADLVFPSFLFATGNAMSFALRRPSTTRAFLTRLVRRAGLIFLLGVLMYWYPFVARGEDGQWAALPFATTRIPGVLQRIALCYAIAALAARWLRPPALALLAIALLVAHWAILVVASPPGLATDPARNIGSVIDRALLGAAHLYRHGQLGFDPEGLLGTLPATANVLAGYLVGLFVQARGKTRATAGRLAAAGALLAVAGLGWSLVWPLSKQLWTGSFALLTIGLDALLLAAIVALVEVADWRPGRAFLTVLGRNPLAIYLFSELLMVTLWLAPVEDYASVYGWISVELVQRVAPGPLGSLLCAIGFALLCWLFGRWLDKRGLILKV